MNVKKRVLLVAPQPYFESRGTPLNVRAMVETLAYSGQYHVDLLVFPFGTDTEIENVCIERSCKVPFINRVPIGPSFQKLFLDFGLFSSALSLSRKHKYDIFHGIEEGAYIAGWLAKREKKPFICDMDSCMETQLRESSIFGTTIASKLFAIMERRAIAESSAVLTVCTALSDKVSAASPGTYICQIEDFPTEGSEEGTPEIIDSLRREFAVSTDEKLLVYTGNFERYQGIDLLLQSFTRVVSQIPVRLMLVGGGQAGSALFESYRTKATELGIESSVTFCGNRPLTEMGSFMALADALVSPRIEGENTPLKLYSYMASGKPVIATDIYSHTQVLDENSAFLAKANIESFSQALYEAINDSEISRSIQLKRADKAKQLVEENYSRASFERRLLNLYGSLFDDVALNGLSGGSGRVIVS